MEPVLFSRQSVNSNRILYTPSSFARTSLIHLQETGTLTARKPHTSQRDGLASYLFFIVEEGSGSLSCDGKTIPLEMGDCVFLDCHQPYSHHTEEDLWTLKWVHFYGPNLKNIYDKYRERGGKTIFHPTNLLRYETLLDDLYHIADTQDHIRDMRICQCLTSLLTLLMEESWNPTEARPSFPQRQNLQEIKEYLDRHFAEHITLDDLAERFFLNKFYLTRIFKEQFGISINIYITQNRITRAKQLLRFSDLSMEAIGQQCGLSDANYFSRVFKKLEGMTPGEYRRRW